MSPWCNLTTPKGILDTDSNHYMCVLQKRMVEIFFKAVFHKAEEFFFVLDPKIQKRIPLRAEKFRLVENSLNTGITGLEAFVIVGII